MKTLTVTLKDLEGIPHADLSARTNVDVEARYTGPVHLTNGTIIPPAVKPKKMGAGSGGRVEFEVYESDSTLVKAEYRNFAIRVDVEVRRTDKRGGPVRVTRTVQVLTSHSSPVALGTLAPAEGVPPQWTTVAEIGAQADAAIQTLSNLKATATTTAPSNPASVTVTGSGVNKKMNFVIPRGADGAPGRDGMGYAEGLDAGVDRAERVVVPAVLCRCGDRVGHRHDILLPRLALVRQGVAVQGQRCDVH